MLKLIGIGPGSTDDMTIRADRALREADVIIGYDVYVDLVRARYADKIFITTPMRREVERCEIALARARDEQVALICSGDSGIYGLASLVYELRGEAGAPEVEVIPGITAACSGAAILGAPLTHDFAVISLSDRLTEMETIFARLRAAAAADLGIALYNPASRTRPDHLARACDVLLEVLPGDRICGIARNIGRAGEQTEITTLAELKDAAVDMFCTVFIGNRSTRVIGDRMITPRGYRHD